MLEGQHSSLTLSFDHQRHQLRENEVETFLAPYRHDKIESAVNNVHAAWSTEDHHWTPELINIVNNEKWYCIDRYTNLGRYAGLNCSKR